MGRNEHLNFRFQPQKAGSLFPNPGTFFEPYLLHLSHDIGLPKRHQMFFPTETFKSSLKPLNKPPMRVNSPPFLSPAAVATRSPTLSNPAPRYVFSPWGLATKYAPSTSFPISPLSCSPIPQVPTAPTSSPTFSAENSHPRLTHLAPKTSSRTPFQKTFIKLFRLQASTDKKCLYQSPPPNHQLLSSSLFLTLPGS
jgi:hypothetical protein